MDRTKRRFTSFNAATRELMDFERGVMEYPEHVARLAGTCPSLAEQVRSFTNLRHVLDWMKRTGLDLIEVNVIAQDEFNHDFLFRFDGDGKFLVFGMS